MNIFKNRNTAPLVLLAFLGLWWLVSPYFPAGFRAFVQSLTNYR